MKKIIVTGGSGFIGGYVLSELQHQKCECAIIDENVKEGTNYKTYKASLLDETKLEEALLDFKPDAVIHLAAIARVTHCDTVQLYNVNICGTENVLRAVEKYNTNTKVVMISTAGVYGNQDAETYSEELPYNPANHYSYSKMIDEYLAKQYESLDIRIVRPFNIVGAGQSDYFIVPKLIKGFATGEKEIRMGNVKPLRDYVEVTYCARVIVKLALEEKVKYTTYNVCSGIGTSVEDVIEMLAELSGHKPDIIQDSEFVRKNEVWKLVGDNTRVLDLMMGEHPRPLCEVIKEMFLEKMSELQGNS